MAGRRRRCLADALQSPTVASQWRRLPERAAQASVHFARPDVHEHAHTHVQDLHKNVATQCHTGAKQDFIELKVNLKQTLGMGKCPKY